MSKLEPCIKLNLALEFMCVSWFWLWKSHQSLVYVLQHYPRFELATNWDSLCHTGRQISGDTECQISSFYTFRCHFWPQISPCISNLRYYLSTFNLRYLALESMCILATSEFSHEAVKKHQETVNISSFFFDPARNHPSINVQFLDKKYVFRSLKTTWYIPHYRLSMLWKQNEMSL